MKLSNAQLRLLLPLVLREAKENPRKDWDVLVERMVRMASQRGDRNLLRQLGLMEEKPAARDELREFGEEAYGHDDHPLVPRDTSRDKPHKP